MRDRPDMVAKAGDATLLGQILTDDAGNPINLTDATIRLVLKAISGDGVAIAVVGSASGTPTDGEARWSPAAVPAGDYLGEWEVTKGGNAQTYPNGHHLHVRVSGDLD